MKTEGRRGEGERYKESARGFLLDDKLLCVHKGTVGANKNRPFA